MDIVLGRTGCSWLHNRQQCLFSIWGFGFPHLQVFPLFQQRAEGLRRWPNQERLCGLPGGSSLPLCWATSPSPWPWGAVGRSSGLNISETPQNFRVWALHEVRHLAGSIWYEPQHVKVQGDRSDNVLRSVVRPLQVHESRLCPGCWGTDQCQGEEPTSIPGPDCFQNFWLNFCHIS